MRFDRHLLGLALASLSLVLAQDMETSHDGSCGNGVSCMGSNFGSCCSASGECGATTDYCGKGCQIDFGFCQDTQGKPSPDGTCAGGIGYTCKGSGYGDCCSQYEFCGSTDEFCGNGCIPGFGDCSSSTSSNSSTSMTASSSAAASSSSAPPSKKRNLQARTDATGVGCPDGTTYTTPCGAVFQVECNIDHHGGDIWFTGNGFNTDNFDDCLAECARWPNCINVAWRKAGDVGPCYIKDYIGPVVNNTYVWGGILIQNCTDGPASTTPALNTPPYATSTTSTEAASTTDSAITSTKAASTTDSATTSTKAASTTDSATITTITASTYTSTATANSTSTTSPSSCPTAFSKRADDDCVPCQGQSGSLPYCGADVYTDNYKFTPKTCRTVYYTLDITNTTIAPDGRSRLALLVNGQMPGPAIEANWGDTVVVTVNNKMQNNGTSIHFHGIRQLNNSEYDGVPSITQCPIAPGDSMTYTWVATNYGTSWYHSHFAIQAWEGVMGPMIIHGPTSDQYDVDAGTIMLQDWSLRTVDSMYDAAQDAITGGPRRMDNGLINGMNTWGVQGTANQTGQRFELGTKFEPGKSYLFRIINGAIQSTYKFYIDGHTLEVINMDFTNIKPYKTNILNINIGQRYMVIVRADQPVGDYWMRADNQNACSATIQADDIKGIVRYSGSAGATPTTTKYNYTTECVDEPLASLIPMAQINATDKDLSWTKDVTIAANSQQLFKWYLSGTTFDSRYEDPTLVRVLANDTAPTYSGNLILDLPTMGQWIYIVVQSTIPLPHPIHLHGHDFFILAAGTGSYSAGSTVLNLNNPPRRDTANMPARGFLVLAFETDNPGSWLMHCHIGWHTSMGFALQILEGQSLIEDTVKDECALYGTCANWKTWAAQNNFMQHDSGV